jgi:hypothetical protein
MGDLTQGFFFGFRRPGPPFGFRLPASGYRLSGFGFGKSPRVAQNATSGGMGRFEKYFGGNMSGDSKKREKKNLRVELKYCEHCGGLWVREGGGGVYCERCQPKVADLPIPKKKAGKVGLPVPTKKKVRGAVLPVRRHTVVEDYGPGDTSLTDVDAEGGVA